MRNVFDISTKSVKEAQGLFKKWEFRYGNLQNLGFKEREFDFVLDEILKNAFDAYVANRSTGKVLVEIKQDAESFYFSIYDNGIGIDPIKARRLFTFGERLNNALGIQGHGVGLNIAQKIIEQHGGVIWAESEGIGKGATFYFTLQK